MTRNKSIFSSLSYYTGSAAVNMDNVKALPITHVRNTTLATILGPIVIK